MTVHVETVHVESAYRGTAAAAALLLEPEVIGPAAARDRALAAWQPGARLLAVDGCWLLTLPTAVAWRAEQAPGQVLVADRGGLTLPGLPGEPGCLTLVRGGRRVGWALDDLAAVDVTRWFDLGGLARHELRPCDEPAPPPAELGVVPRAAAPDLRTLAGLAEPAAGRRRLAALFGRARFGRARFGRARFGRAAWLAIAALAVVVLALVVLLVTVLLRGDGRPPVTTVSFPPSPTLSTAPVIASSPAPPGFTVVLPPGVSIPSIALPAAPGYSTPSDDHGYLVLPFVGLVIVAIRLLSGLVGVAGRRRAGGTRSGARSGARPGARPPRQGRGWLARLVLGSPARGVVGRRHARYLRRLEDEFARSDWDTALRRAVALRPGSGATMLTLRLPKPRGALTVSGGSGRGSMPWGPSVYEHLRQLYRRAADDLEADGRAEQAAFLLAELLNDPRAAVTLLERRDRVRLAAEIADTRDMEPALRVRLWWRAGERQRALDVARATGCYAAAIVRLAQVDEAAARELRREWVGELGAAGDHIGAAAAAWPEPDLRPLARPGLDAGLELAGPVAARAAAYLACGFADDRSLPLAAVALADDGPAALAFATTLTELDAADPALDRRLCGAALVSFVRSGGVPAEAPAAAARRLLDSLRHRADPVLTADLPSVARARRSPREPIELTLDETGDAPVLDAVQFADGRALLARGEHGLLLLSAGGRVAGWWDRPVDTLVVSDNGARVLLGHHTADDVTLARFDPAGGRIRDWATLRLRHVVPSYDGATLIGVEDERIVFVDTLADRPRIIWHELGDGDRAVLVGRTPEALTALVTVKGVGPLPMPQLWSWRLPQLMLGMRRPIELGRPRIGAVLAGRLLWVGSDDRDPEGSERLSDCVEWSDVAVLRDEVDAATQLRGDGDVYGLGAATADGTLFTLHGPDHRPLARLRLPAETTVWLRRHAQRVTVWTDGGVVVGLDPARGEVTLRAAPRAG